MKMTLEKIEELIDSMKNYTHATIELIKLETAQKTSSIIATLTSGFIIGLVLIFFAFFLSMGVCFYLSELFGNIYLGFGLVAGVYLLLGLVLIVARKSMLIRPIRDEIIREMFQKQEDKEHDEQH